MKAAIRALAALAAVAIVAGLTLPIAGLVSVAASSGHAAITSWLLHFTMRRSVDTQSLGVDPPPLGDVALIVQGAGHFEIGCAPCHGRPGVDPPPVLARMTPPPPYLPPRIDDWEARELYFIVKNGIKFTGMPAWPSQQREDEVWAVVAFLLALPRLDAEEYSALAFGPLAGDPREARRAAPAAASVCIRCHGEDGLGRGVGAFPRLAGLRLEYLHATLSSYATGTRPSGTMQPVAAALDAESLRTVAEYYGSRADAAVAGARREVVAGEGRGAAAGSADGEGARSSPPGAADAVRGARIAAWGIPARDVAPCAYCHGPERVARNPLFPAIAGQPRRYLEGQLELWAGESARGGTAYAHVMDKAASGLTREDIRDVAAYYSALAP